MVFLTCPESFSTIPCRYFSKWRLKIFRGGNTPLPSNFDGSPYPHLRGYPRFFFFIKMTAKDVKEMSKMPGVTFFCVFVRPETNRQGGGKHAPGRRWVKRPEIKHFSRKLQNFPINKLRPDIERNGVQFSDGS